MIIDDISQTVTVSAATRLSDLELQIGAVGFTTGLCPQPMTKELTLSQLILKGLPNLYWVRYGPLQEACIALDWRWKGETIITRNVPRAATGPDLKGLFIGSHGFLGRPVGVTLRIWQAQAAALIVGRFSDERAARRWGISLWAEDLRPAYFGVWEESGALHSMALHHAPRELLPALVKRTKELCSFYGGRAEAVAKQEHQPPQGRAIIDPLNLLETVGDGRNDRALLPKTITRRLLGAVR